MTTNATDNLLALNLEYRLTIAHRINGGCECIRYLMSRREVLILEVLKAAEAQGKDPVDLFAEFARDVHARHESGLSLAVSA